MGQLVSTTGARYLKPVLSWKLSSGGRKSEIQAAPVRATGCNARRKGRKEEIVGLAHVCPAQLPI